MACAEVKPDAHTHHPVTCDGRNECAAEVHIDFSFGNGNGFRCSRPFGKADIVAEEIGHGNGACQIAQADNEPVAYQFVGADAAGQSAQSHNHHIACCQLAAAD